MARRTVTVIGAGVSGLAAAHTLCALGCQVLLLDKGTSVGGRMATRYFDAALGKRRYIDTASRDIQLQGPSTAQFKALLVKLGHCTETDTQVTGEPGINSFAKAFAKALPAGQHQVLCSCTVSGIAYDQASSLFTVKATQKLASSQDKEVQFESQGVIVTAPVPQADKLVAKSFPGLSHDIKQGPGYFRALMLLLWPKRSMKVADLNAHEAFKRIVLHDHIEANKTAGPIPLSIYVGEDLTEAHYTAKDPVAVEDKLLEMAHVSRDAFDKVQLKKWGFAQPKVDQQAVLSQGDPAWRAEPSGVPILVASDGLGPGLIGEAGEAGIQAAKALDRLLTQSKHSL